MVSGNLPGLSSVKQAAACTPGLSVREKGRVSMKSKIIIDGNAFYEVDEECMERKKKLEKDEEEKKEEKS